MIGQNLSHCKIITKIGAGGMGNALSDRGLHFFTHSARGLCYTFCVQFTEELTHSKYHIKG